MAVATIPATENIATPTRKIAIPEFRRAYIEAKIQGLTPLICHRYSEAEREKMEAAQQGAAKTKKPPREPDREFQEAQYRLQDGGHGFPAIGIKKAMVLAGQRFGDEKGTELYGAFTIPGEFLRLEIAAEPRMRADRVVLSGASRTASIAYRPEYWPWAITVPIAFNATFISLDQIVNLLTMAGMSVGIGDWRVDKKGNFGTWEVADVRALEYEG
jgi:hypothetical protein